MTSLQIKDIIRNRGNVVVSADDFTSLTLRTLASTAAGEDCGTLTIRHAYRLNSVACRNIATAGRGKVTFDFT